MGASSPARTQSDVAQDRGLLLPRVRGEADAFPSIALLQDTYELGTAKGASTPDRGGPRLAQCGRLVAGWAVDLR